MVDHTPLPHHRYAPVPTPPGRLEPTPARRARWRRRAWSALAAAWPPDPGLVVCLGLIAWILWLALTTAGPPPSKGGGP